MDWNSCPILGPTWIRLVNKWHVLTHGDFSISHIMCHVIMCHVIIHISRQLSVQVIQKVRWQLNPWRPTSSQILGFGLGSMGFRQIYDSFRTSWITLIYDKNLRTSREGIHDAQYMAFSIFVIDVVLWWIFDDPWRKWHVIDYNIFCSDVTLNWNFAPHVILCNFAKLHKKGMHLTLFNCCKSVHIVSIISIFMRQIFSK
jgi:hypothetical protein